MSDLIGNPEDRFSHNEAHNEAHIYSIKHSISNASVLFLRNKMIKFTYFCTIFFNKKKQKTKWSSRSDLPNKTGF